MEGVILKDFGGTDNFVMDDNLPIPVPGDSEILVEIKATAFNPIDYQIRQGKTERKRMHSPILGREFSGIVIKTGALVTRFSVGDAVFAASGSIGSNGTYAQYISIPELIAAKIPNDLSFDAAAAIPVVCLTALQTFNRLPLKEGDRIFISGGAGGVGLALIKLLLAAGHTRLIATAGNPESKQQVINAGLPENQIIDYRQENLAAVTIAANNGFQFDHSIDTAGG